MKIAIVHYHLRRGGVTRVIESAVSALEKKGHEVLVISGEEPASPADFSNTEVLPGLGYRKVGNVTISMSLTEALMELARSHFGSLPDVWHFHNHSLGKNVLVPSVTRELADRGQRVLLQMHDFSEDGRPTNYATQRSFFDSELRFEGGVYPLAKQIHYAAINERDRGFLAAAGVPLSNLHLLPNAVTGLDVQANPDDRPVAKDKLFALYPTRGIRRKNIGEVLLLSLLHEGRIHFATTLSPENSEWVSIHDQWKALAAELELPVTLGICDDGEYEFTDMIGWSDLIITTSIAEGFGLAFLEPWLVGKSVAGRKLPSITNDFTVQGIHLGHLYERIDIPLSWLDEGEIRREMDGALRQGYLAYHRELPKDAVEQAWSRWVQDGNVDFGKLSEKFQVQILRKIAEDPDSIAELKVPGIVPADDSEIAEKRVLIQKLYSVDSYGEKLENIYGKVRKGWNGKVRHMATGKVLNQFLDPKRLNLLRT